MAVGYEYKVTVLRGRIITLIQVGDVARWSHDTAQQIERLARLLSPVATGRLKASHVTLPGTGSNQFEKRWRISANAPYSLYRHRGTGIYGPNASPIIYSKPAGPIGFKANGKPQLIRSSKGTPGDNWMERAANGVVI